MKNPPGEAGCDRLTQRLRKRDAMTLLCRLGFHHYGPIFGRMECCDGYSNWRRCGRCGHVKQMPRAYVEMDEWGRDLEWPIPPQR